MRVENLIPYISYTAKYIKNIYSLYNIMNNACRNWYSLYSMHGKPYKKHLLLIYNSIESR